MAIKGLHHNAYRCRDSEETRKFYEDFLGLPLAHTLEIRETKTGRRTDTLHTFYEMDDGSYLAFFEAPDMKFTFKKQKDFDLHIALEVEPATLEKMLAKGKKAGIETRGRVRSSLHPLDLFPRSERLCDRADRQGAGTRGRDGPEAQRRAREAHQMAEGETLGARNAK